MWRTVLLVLLPLLGLAACNEYLARLYEPDLAEQPSDKTKYEVDLRVCRDELAAKPDTNPLLVPFSLRGYGATGPAQDNGTIMEAEETINNCMAAKGYRIKPWPSAG